MPSRRRELSRRCFNAALLTGAAGATASGQEKSGPRLPAQIAITFDLEMSRHYPKRGMTEWDYQKGNLDDPTKRYAVRAAEIVKKHGAAIHFFCVGRVLEQPDAAWLKQLAEAGHAVGNHTYDHVNVLAATPAATQFRFQRAPWLVAGKSAAEIIQDNIVQTNAALKSRAGVAVNGFRTPGGFRNGLSGRQDIQKMLLDLGFTWVSSKYPPHDAGRPREQPDARIFSNIVAAQAQAQPFVYPSGLVEIPMSPISDVSAFRARYWKLKSFLEAIRRSVQWAIATGGVFDFLCHPSCMVVEDPEFRTVKMICDTVAAAGEKAQFVTLDAIAGRVASRRS